VGLDDVLDDVLCLVLPLFGPCSALYRSTLAQPAAPSTLTILPRSPASELDSHGLAAPVGLVRGVLDYADGKV
jgi:hypothetical protein